MPSVHPYIVEGDSFLSKDLINKKIQEIVGSTKGRITVQDENYIEIETGSAKKTRFWGGWLVKTEHLPQRIQIMMSGKDPFHLKIIVNDSMGPGPRAGMEQKYYELLKETAEIFRRSLEIRWE